MNNSPHAKHSMPFTAPITTVYKSNAHELPKVRHIATLIMKLNSALWAFITTLSDSFRYLLITYVPENITSDSKVRPTPSNVWHTSAVSSLVSYYIIVAQRTPKQTSIFASSDADVFSRIVQ